MLINLYKRQPYPEAFKFNEFMLKVSDKHELFVSEYGNPNGTPVIKLHGGPGYYSKPSNTTVFNPFKYRIILFDQRGCGKSSPSGELVENTTQDLIEDIEKIRNHLSIEKWNIVGGSWGSCLALAYAQAYPANVNNMIINGIFTFRKHEVSWVYEQVKVFFPDVYEKFIEVVPDEFKGNPVKYYSDKILNNINPDPELVKRFSYLEGNILSLYPLDERMNLDYEITQEQIDSTKIFLHYESNKGFLEEGQLLKLGNIDKLRNIPAVIIQGRYDMVCPMETAWELHKLWPEADFEIVNDAGHTSSEPGIVNAIVKWTDKFSSI